MTVFDKRSLMLTPRNPLKQDETLINYELDSEEEWHEEHGEDLQDQGEEEDDYGEEAQEEQDGFIVPDNYFSDDEIKNNEDSEDNEFYNAFR